jgi:hypothetical protein
LHAVKAFNQASEGKTLDAKEISRKNIEADLESKKINLVTDRFESILQMAFFTA